MKTVAIFICSAALLGISLAFSQTATLKNVQTDSVRTATNNISDFFSLQFAKRVAPPNSISKIPGHYSAADWRRAIDSVWGPGLPTSQKLQIFDKVWNVIDTGFACFHDLNINWDSLGSVYRAEITNGVSRGRFAAIMTHLSLALKESHTRVSDNSVYLSTALNPGVPLFVIGGWGENFHFGAGLTPLPDSSLLVYAAKPQHPLGLVPGDIVLGYDRIPWKQLYKELLAAQLPLSAYSWWGCSESSFIHSMLMSAGLNWHLFDTIDIVKYASGDTVHLSTGYLQGISGSFFCTEQLDVPGIPKPAYDGQHVVSYGIILGTNIGYIYGSAWSGNAQQEFFDAVQALMYTDGLIIDFRINFGGNMFLSNPGLNLLFASPTTTIGFGKRSNPLIREAMVPYVDPSAYVIPGNPQGYTKPIAVLTGPGAVSSGDQVALRMKFHPHVKIFGKSTATAFNAPITISLGNPDWFFRYARSDAYLASNPGVYLTHREFQVDYPVWHTPSAVAQGRDNVVDAARAWIDSSLGIKPVQAFLLQQNYPNPFNSQTGIRYELFNQTGVRLEIYNILGQLVRTLVDEKQPAGHYAVPWNGRDQYGHSLASGVYFYRLRSTEYVETKKLMLLR